MRTLIVSILLLFTNNLLASDIPISDYVKYERNARLTYTDGLKLTENNKSVLLVWVNFTPEQVIPLYNGVKDDVIHVFVKEFDKIPTNESVLVVGRWQNNQIERLKDIKTDYLIELNKILHPEPIKVTQKPKIIEQVIDNAHKTSPSNVDHAHHCPFCNVTWYHDDSFYNNVNAHKCPKCGRGPFFDKYSQIIPQQQIIPQHSVSSFNPVFCPPGKA